MLRPGDVLYLPPGVWHRARAVGESLHVSVTVRAANLVDRVAQLLAPLLVDPRWRRQPEPGDDLEDRLRKRGRGRHQAPGSPTGWATPNPSARS
ncbi:MAG TPA: cupin domain-containing protein [Kofleriaceae bacterium]|nr:cupin domain-containing protein [Kofleriaceae bacterium]